LGNLSENFHGLRKYAQDSFVAIQNKLREVERRGVNSGASSGIPFEKSFEFKRFTDRMQRLEDQASEFHRDNLRPSMGGREDTSQVHDLLRRLNQLESETGDGAPNKDSGSWGNLMGRLGEEPSFRALAGRVAKLEHSTPEATIDNGLSEVESRVSRAEARGGDEMFELGEYAFGLFDDFAKWVLEENVPTSGSFWDMFSCLGNMRLKGLSGKERADEQHSSERISTTMFENNLLAAMSHVRPAGLYGK
jgi:hypothetical protein